jgi:hypothetical protein
VRHAEENERAEHCDGYKEEKNHEEKSLEQTGESAECGGKLLLLAAAALEIRGELSHLLPHLLELFALAFDARAETTAFRLHFAEVAIERGEVGSRLDCGFADDYAGEHWQ